jgi:hypothetical protein
MAEIVHTCGSIATKRMAWIKGVCAEAEHGCAWSGPRLSRLVHVMDGWIVRLACKRYLSF